MWKQPMTDSEGQPPRSGFAALAPELIVVDLEVSLSFWVNILGFEIAYRRPAQRFAYLELSGGAQVMLCERSGHWETGPLEPPFGRGMMLQIKVPDFDAVLDQIRLAAWPIHTGPRKVWRELGDRVGGQREVFVQDPDGYLIMLAAGLEPEPQNG